MRSSVFALALALLLPACSASGGDLALARGELNDVPGELDTSCNVDVGPGGVTDGQVLDGTRNGIWCCGVAECTDRVACGDNYGSFVEVCAVCDYYECIPGSGLASIDPTVGEPPPPAFDPSAVAALGELAVERPRSTVSLVSLDLGLLETADVSIERDLSGRTLADAEGQQCQVLDRELTGGVLRRGMCCGVVPCPDLSTCRLGGRTQRSCVSCDSEVCLTTTSQPRL
jgi:hypothetical protein